MNNLITDHMDIWTAAQTQKSYGGRGRGGNGNGQNSHGIKKLRELILELAVRGKLVPQDPKDETASLLLERVAKERRRLVKEGKIKKETPLPEIARDEKPFELPHGWAWARLGNISADIHYGYTASANQQIKKVRLLRITDIQNDSVNWEAVPGCEITENKINDFKLENGDILIARTGGTIGKSYLVDSINLCSVFASYLLRVKRINEIYPYFIKAYLGSQLYWKQLYESSMGTGQPNVNGNALKNLVVALPPLSEQHRVVSKANELMTLCDQLEQQQTDSNDTQQTLVETLLATLTEAANPKEFAQAWQRIADHFDTLFTTEPSINQLKQTILQLAVMGKLVPQDPNDEPASVLLEKITKEKKRLTKEGKIKKEIDLTEIKEEEKPFGKPAGWCFVRLIELTKIITKGSSPKWQGVRYTDDPKDVLFITSENVGSYVVKLDNRKYVETKFNEMEPRSILKKGDFLMNIVGASIGRTALYDIDDLANINQAVCLIRAFSQFLDSQYLLHFFNSNICVSYMFDKQVDNARANLSMGNIAKFVIPLPPFGEQRRIAAKVEELMALCDELKARLNAAKSTQIQLADAIVEKAVA